MARVQQEVVRRAQEMIEDGAMKEKAAQPGDVDTKETPQVRWNLGDLEFEAYMRMMDNAVSSTDRLFCFLFCFYCQSEYNKQYVNLHKCEYPVIVFSFLF